MQIPNQTVTHSNLTAVVSEGSLTITDDRGSHIHMHGDEAFTHVKHVRDTGVDPNGPYIKLLSRISLG